MNHKVLTIVPIVAFIAVILFVDAAIGVPTPPLANAKIRIKHIRLDAIGQGLPGLVGLPAAEDFGPPGPADPPPPFDKNTCFSPNDNLVDGNNNNWTHVFENAKYSVVKVLTGSNPYSKPEISTGFIYDNDGHIVTNYHVANSGNLIKVTFADGNSYRVQITGTDPDSDLAILQANEALNKEQMKSLPIGDSSALQVGENVGSIGYPFEQLSFSVGSIKQLNITRHNFGSVQTGLIQHDACGYHGSSGGPLLDLQGRVLGINSYPGLRGHDIPGLTLAIPSNTLQKVVPKLISQHRYNLSLPLPH